MPHIRHTLFGYIPNLPVNVIGAVIFGIITVIQFLLGIYTNDWWMFVTWTIAAGGECAAYIGRSILHTHYTSSPLWEMQLVLTILCPAFMSAGLYYQLAVQIVVYGQRYSYLKPMTYNAIFTTCDVIALVIQAVGGGKAAANIDGGDPDTGGWIMVGGISFQVLTLVIFILMFGVINFNIYRDPKNWDPKFNSLRQRWIFKLWVPSVAISLLFLLIRSIYRIVELATGWRGYVITTERYFLVLDGLMIVLGMVPLCIVYPALAYSGVKVPGLHKTTDSNLTKEVDKVNTKKYTKVSIFSKISQ